jgi:hypothetical protein
VTRRKAAQLAIRVVVLSAVASAFGGLSSYIMRVSEAQPVDAATGIHPLDQQVSNKAAKTDRLAGAAPIQLASAESKPFTLASVTSTPEVERAPSITAAPVAEPAPSQQQAALPAPARKPKLPAPPPALPSNALSDEQISGLRTRLQLTSDQVEYWPAVESALRDVARTQLSGSRVKQAHSNIDVNSPEVQKLIYAAMPLLFRLREDQKREVRKLARIMGLESVASQI